MQHFQTITDRFHVKRLHLRMNDFNALVLGKPRNNPIFDAMNFDSPLATEEKMNKIEKTLQMISYLFWYILQIFRILRTKKI